MKFLFLYGSVHYMKNFIRLEPVPDKFIETGTGNQCLCILKTAEQIILPVPVQFR